MMALKSMRLVCLFMALIHSGEIGASRVGHEYLEDFQSDEPEEWMAEDEMFLDASYDEMTKYSAADENSFDSSFFNKMTKYSSKEGQDSKQPDDLTVRKLKSCENGEIQVEKNNLVKIVNQDKFWRLSFEIKPLEMTKKPAAIIHLTTGSDCCEKGSRIPAIFFKPNSFEPQICTAIGTNGNVCYNGKALEPNKFTRIVIQQVNSNYKRNEYSISINGKVVHKLNIRNPQRYKGVKIILGKDSEKYDAAKAIIKDLVYTNLDDGFKIKKNNLATTVRLQNKAWRLTFEVKPVSKTSNKATIIHLTKGGDCCKIGTRIPAMFFKPDSFIPEICTAVNKKGNKCYEGKELVPNKFTNFTIQQIHTGFNQYTYSILISGKEEFKRINMKARKYHHVKMLVGDNENDAANAIIRKISYKNLPDGYPVKKSREIGRISEIYRGWKLSIYVKPIKVSTKWTSIIELTTGNNRIPAIFFKPNSFIPKFYHEGNQNVEGKALEPNKFTRIDVRQLQSRSGKHVYSILINKRKIFEETSPNPKTYQNVKVFIGNRRHEAANALVKKLSFHNVLDKYAKAVKADDYNDVMKDYKNDDDEKIKNDDDDDAKQVYKNLLEDAGDLINHLQAYDDDFKENKYQEVSNDIE